MSDEQGGNAGDPPSNRERLARATARYVISPQIYQAFQETRPEDAGGEVRRWVIIEINLDDENGRQAAHDRVADKVELIKGTHTGVEMKPRTNSRHHIFAKLSLAELTALVAEDSAQAKVNRASPGIYKVWPDRDLDAYLDRSVRIIKADACLRSFGSDGDGIIWAVADSGIEGGHPHFRTFKNLEFAAIGAPPARSGRQGFHAPVEHRDFTAVDEQPLVDGYGHGTHVAGIVAGIAPEFVDPEAARKVRCQPYKIIREKDEAQRVRNHVEKITKPIQGVAPKAKLVSLKVLDANGKGQESSLLAAIDYIAQVNDDGRWPRIHGLNLSLGYSFEAEWFAAGQSPLCVAVNRLVKQGVVVVAAAGNDGSAIIATENSRAGRRVGMDQSITDPGNAEYAITVGSTHAEQPHTYGVSYFSSRGPTADGRQKPDLIAPGERIVSAASTGSIDGLKLKDPALVADALLGQASGVYYREETGTSMAAPHVSGAVAAFLSVRREFIGQPERIKEILMSSATDLKRRRDFQGAGLLDLLRAIQSV